MRKIRNRLISIIGIASLSLTVFMGSSSNIWASDKPQELPQKDAVLATKKEVRFTVHEYDWTSYKNDYNDAVRQDCSGDRNLEWEADMAKYGLENVDVTLIKVSDLGHIYESSTDELEAYVTYYTLDDEWKDMLFDKNDENYLRDDFTIEELNKAVQDHKMYLERSLIDYDSHKSSIILKTDKKGEATAIIPKEEIGLYMVAETKVPENVEVTTDPFFVSLPMTNGSADGWNYDIHVYPKNQTSIPDIRKLVKTDFDSEFKDSTTVSCGDTVYYNLIARIPKVTSVATELGQFEFVDRLPVGIECEFETANNQAFIMPKNRLLSASPILLTKAFQFIKPKTNIANGEYALKNPEDITVKIFDDRTNANQDTENVIAEFEYLEDYTLSYTYVNNGNSMLHIIFTEKGIEKINRYNQFFITVRYKAIVGDIDEISVGDEGNRSDVTLIYGRTSTAGTSSSNTQLEGELASQEIEDAAIILTYGIQMQKTFDTNPSDYSRVKEVQFVVKNLTDSRYMIGELRTDPNTGDELQGNYKITGITEHENEATRFSPGTDGILTIDGMKAVTYEVTEINTVNGYELLNKPVIIDIVAKQFSTIPTKATLSGQDEAANVIVIDVHGKEKATATVNGEPAEIDEEGRVPRVKLTVLNCKSVSPIANIFSKNPITGDTNKLYIMFGIMLLGFGAFYLRKKIK